ncbi:MAG: helix-turn-helix transcriptional regulator, partial [Oscillospiraceae bacterium]|nr:helix-turn-helix transcriptional regulator [Oscillospiraceae bacterium]
MGTLYENIMSLCESHGIKGGKMCTDLGISKGLLTDLKMGRRSGVSAATAQKIANYFGVTVGHLLGEENEKTPTLTKKDERDIARDVERIMED